MAWALEVAAGPDEVRFCAETKVASAKTGVRKKAGNRFIVALRANITGPR